LLTAIITGAQGFLGRYIAAEFVARGWNVIGLDRNPASQEGAPPLRLHEAHTMDLRSEPLDSLLSEKAPALIVHAAGSSSVSDSMADPCGDFENGVGIFFYVLNAVRRCAPTCRVLFLSSASVYGNPDSLPVSEDAPPRPVSAYGFHKSLCETLLQEFHSLYGVRSCAVRVFSAYGPGLRRQVLWDICQKALKLQSFQLSGTGDETRDFVHARDVAQAVRIVSEKAAFRAEAYNVASGEETRIADLARTVVSSLATDSAFTFSGTRRLGDPIRWRADITRISRLGYRAQVPLEEGVREYAAWVHGMKESRQQPEKT
jgi:UDP-glucose 4-epimerase